MKKVELNQLSQFTGGNFGDSFCNAFGAGFAVYQSGVWANIWNPAGQTALGIAAVIGGGCALYAMR